MKNEWKWLIGFALLSTLLVGIMSDFKFRNVEIQHYDTYFVFNAARTIFYLTFVLWTIKNAYLLVDLMTTKYTIIAVLVSIINPLVGLFIIIIIYMGMQAVITSGKIYPDRDFVTYLVPVCVLIGVVVLQIVVEIRVLAKLSNALKINPGRKKGSL